MRKDGNTREKRMKCFECCTKKSKIASDKKILLQKPFDNFTYFILNFIQSQQFSHFLFELSMNFCSRVIWREIINAQQQSVLVFVYLKLDFLT